MGVADLRLGREESCTAFKKRLTLKRRALCMGTVPWVCCFAGERIRRSRDVIREGLEVDGRSAIAISFECCSFSEPLLRRQRKMLARPS